MERIVFSCGAVLKSSFSAVSNTGNAIHSGCTES
jgi:hypothetical protein